MIPSLVGLYMVLPFPFPVGFVPVMGVDGGGGGGVDVEEFPRPEIKCCHYLSSVEKCAHVLIAPFLSTTGMMSWSL